MKAIKYFQLSLFCFCSIFTQVKAQGPNIIFVLADDVGFKSLTCNGGSLYNTPNIDSLSAGGMRFTQCQATPLCSPSRVTLLTGKYNFRNYTQWGVLDQSQKTIGNMMKDAGYKTGYFGKWQLSGGDQSINAFGFSEYTVHDALDNLQMQSRYKNPHIYTHGDFLDDSLTLNKYGPDIISDSVLSFIDRNQSNPFFIYYPMILVHEPFSPTPDDQEFANWNPKTPEDTTYFPSMMTYMDKLIGNLINKLKVLGIEKNTVIIFSGDNGTPSQVGDYVNENDSIVNGGKKLTNEAGTHVPLIVYWPGTIAPGSTNNDLIDFTDFLPTIAGIAGISLPTDYGALDGINFSSKLSGNSGTTTKMELLSF